MSGPSKKQVINNTGIVIIVLIISACIIGGFDFVMTNLASLFFMLSVSLFLPFRRSSKTKTCPHCELMARRVL